MKNIKDLEVFLATDQPESCRYCGSRTEFMGATNSQGKQIHHCPNCHAVYVVDDDGEAA
jgi:hypothetical protein